MLNNWGNFQFSIMKKLWDLVQENQVNIQGTLTYLISAQDGISEYWGQIFFVTTWKKGFYYIEINEQGGQKLKNQ